MAKKNSASKTAAKIVMDVFHKYAAYDESRAIGIKRFKNVKLTSQVVGYTIANFMQDDIVIKTDDDKYYFNEKAYKKLQRKVMFGYGILILVPFLCIVLFTLFKHFFSI
ncbi:hypothetical protein A4S06_07400 [Erysipelotrichaceae bacterium MTC7]|nr:hypothetical protein A4S06_07400 [Erysipelotrichaceae bacterium MTC7]